MHLGAVPIFGREFVTARVFHAQMPGLTLSHDGSNQGYYAFASNGIDVDVEVVPAGNQL